ncbi:adenosine receptor A2b-like [Patiria miniata]|uniref:G-protein coupled receptors family 1 profile domain-containing protein n=1 Tax=Patiria miniata TaxID=46514 RepID=A0A913ZAN8_PATMI|nr:adenosine receptor A2b-like [Patiria miniata]
MELGALDVATIAVEVIGGLAIACNLMAVAVFATTKSLHRKYYWFILNLVLADIASPTLAIVQQVRPGKAPVALVRGAAFAAELSILSVALNNFLAIVIPSRYDVIVTRCRMVVYCLFIWVLSLSTFLVLTYIQEYAFWIVRPLLSLTVIILTGILYCVVFLTIKKYRESQASTTGNDLTADRLRRTRRLMITFTVILVTSCVCQIPFCSINIMIFFSGKDLWGQDYSVLVFHKWSVAFVLLSSLANPFIYWWRLVDFRSRFCKKKNADETELATVNTQAPM